jgi:hypothetical protein
MATETALITGASSGIGRELARCFADGGADLVLVARREEALRTVADELESEHGITARVMPSDLAKPDAPQALFDQCAAEGITVDVVVNNAGFGARGPVAELDTQRQVDMVQVNVTALTHLTRLFLPSMLDRGHGGVLNVASTAAFQPGPNMSVYYATKAYVLSFTEGLAEEVRGTGVHVSCLAPGATDTEFVDRADMEDTTLFKLGAMTPDDVARAGYEGFRSNTTLVVPGALNKLTAASVRFIPRTVARRIAQSLQS